MKPQALSWNEWCARVSALLPDKKLPVSRSITNLIDWWSSGYLPNEAAAKLQPPKE